MPGGSGTAQFNRVMAQWRVNLSYGTVWPGDGGAEYSKATAWHSIT